MKPWTYPLLGEKRVPINNSAAFGWRRRFHIHEGVDLHIDEKEGEHRSRNVFAVEDGVVKKICWFTGPAVGSDWWLPTMAVMVEGASGVVVYGEIMPHNKWAVGTKIEQGQAIGKVERVLIHDKGAPVSMLHLELREAGHYELFDWALGTPQPKWLLDPTRKLLDSVK